MKRKLLVIMIIAILVLQGGCSSRPISTESFAMDTIIEITVYDSTDQAAVQDCLLLLDEYDLEWSAYREDSAIDMLNKNGQAVLRDDTAELMLIALAYASLSDGAFDPTIYPVVSLWHLSSRTAEEPLPDEEALAAACALVDADAVQINQIQDGGVAVTLKPGMGIDLGGVAKGFAADKLKAYLLSRGVKHAILNLGGNVCLLGDETYTVGLADPRSNDVFGKLSVSDVQVVTSGDYQRYIEVDGQRIHHIFDPKTGLSVHNGLCSVTIIGQNGAQCDALSTAVFVLGVENGLPLVRAQGVDAVLVCEDGKIYLTEGAKEVFTLVNTAYTVQ